MSNDNSVPITHDTSPANENKQQMLNDRVRQFNCTPQRILDPSLAFEAHVNFIRSKSTHQVAINRIELRSQVLNLTRPETAQSTTKLFPNSNTVETRALFVSDHGQTGNDGTLSDNYNVF